MLVYFLEEKCPHVMSLYLVCRLSKEGKDMVNETAPLFQVAPSAGHFSCQALGMPLNT